ncbi:hypothetical protein HPB52_001717 [Rhipicephalus sanguineus]|uniref:Chitinase n=1 Tax=Rhipicephalus sanguineus TaxID=34632 RepID=A0A9D4QEU2_RHISA|nr:hypothetical protein HPB52_001717 [Rhipicephalus sanguineus]
MAEAFVFRDKTTGPESAARSTFGRRTWLIVGVMTSAMLLMCTSVAVLQRRYDLTGYFRHSPAAAAAAAKGDWDRQSTANATLRKTDGELEREQLSTSTHGAAVATEIKPRQPLQAKNKRKARANSTARLHDDGSQVASVHKASTNRGATRRPRDGSNVVEVDRELEIVQRPFADGTGAGEEDASPIGRVDAKKELSVAGTAETVRKSEARVASSPGVGSTGASEKTQPSTSDLTGVSSGSQKAEEASPTVLPPSDVAVFSTGSVEDSSATPRKDVRMVKKRRKLRRLVTLPASTSSSDSVSTSTARAGDTSALARTAETGDAQSKKEEVEKNEHDQLNNTSGVATGLSSESPTTSIGRTADTDVESSDASSGNMSSSITQVRSSSSSVNGVTFTTKRELAETSGDQEQVSKQGTAVGVIGSTPNVAVAGVENFTSTSESSSADASGNNETDTNQSNEYDPFNGTSNASLREVSSSSKSSSQLRTSFTTVSALDRSTEIAQSPQINETSTDADIVDVVAGGVKSAEAILEKILNKATKDGRNNSTNSTRDRAGPAETSKGADGRVTRDDGAGDASSSVAATSAHTQPPSESKESSGVRAMTYSTDQNRSTSTETSAKEFATRRQAAEGSPEKMSSTTNTSLLESSTPVSTSDNPVEVIGASTDAGPPDEIIPETEAASTATTTREMTTPETTTSTFAYYTGQDEWIPESRGRYRDVPRSHSNKRKPEFQGKGLPAHHVLVNNREPMAPGDHSSHQTTRSADAGIGDMSGKAERHETREGTTSKAIPRVQHMAPKANVQSAMSELYSSLNEAIREESKHDVGQGNDEMLDYGVVPGDVVFKNQHDSLMAQSAFNMSGFGPDVRRGQSETGTSTQSDQQRGSTSIMVVTHPGSANRSAGWNKTSSANPEPLAFNVNNDERSHAHTFETSSTKAKQDTPPKGLTLSNRDSDGMLSKTSNALTSAQRSSVSDDIATKSSHAPAAKLLVEKNSSSSDATSTEPRARNGVSYIDKHKPEPYAETPPNVLDIGADLPEAETRSGRNQPDTHPSAEEHAASPTNGSMNSNVTTRYFENRNDIKYGDTRKYPQGSTSGHILEESMENGNSSTRTSRASDTIDADLSGSRVVVNTTGGIKLKTSRPNVHRTGVACVYRKDHAGWASGNTTYGLDTLPYQYCASVVYCCLGLREDFAIEDLGNHSDFTKLAKIKGDKPGLQTFVVIKADNSTAPSFKRLISGTMHQDIFVLLAVHWLKTRDIDGAYLYWPQMEDSDGDELVSAFRYLVGSFAKSNLKFGIVLPPGTRYFAKRSTMKALTEDLDGSYDALLLSPPEMDESAYTGKLSSPTQALAGEYGKYPGDLAGIAVCPMIPFWGKTFKMQAVLQDSDLALRPVGRGGARRTSREPGKLAFFEFCRELGNSLYVFPSRENAMIGDEYVTFLTPATLETYLTSSTHASWRCLGSWGPEWDDFDGHCGLGRYPLLKTLYEFHKKRAANAPAAFGLSKASQS